MQQHTPLPTARSPWGVCTLSLPTCTLLLPSSSPPGCTHHHRQVVDLLCISESEATRALRYYKWDLGKLQVRASHQTHTKLFDYVNLVKGTWRLALPATASHRCLASHTTRRCRCACPQEDWFGDPERVRTQVGLLDEQPGSRRAEETCKICFEAHPVGDMASARCRHYYCKVAWGGWV